MELGDGLQIFQGAIEIARSEENFKQWLDRTFANWRELWLITKNYEK